MQIYLSKLKKSYKVETKYVALNLDNKIISTQPKNFIFFKSKKANNFLLFNLGNIKNKIKA